MKVHLELKAKIILSINVPVTLFAALVLFFS